MSRPSQKKRPLRLLVSVAVLTTGTTFLSIPSCEGLLTTVNPCGTIFSFCQPHEIDALFADVPDFSLDPTCSIPFFGVDNPSDAGGTGCATIEVFPTTPGSRPQGEQP